MGGLYTSSIGLSKDLLQRLMMEKCLEEENTSEDDVELNLGLSLGGCHGKPTRKSPDGFRNSQKGDDFGLQREDSSHGDFEDFFGVKEEEVPKMVDPGPTQEMLVQQKKRELHALRRQEARKKRGEKQLQRARREVGVGVGIRPVQLPSNKGRNGFVPLAPSYAPFPMRGSNTVFPMRVGSGVSEEDKRVLGAQMASLKNKQRVAKESGPCRSDRKEAKKAAEPAINDKSSRPAHEKMLSSSNGGDHPNPAGNEVSGSCCPETTVAAYPALPISYSFQPQCMPVPMGFSFPYMVPYWVDAPKGCAAATPPLPPNVLQPVPTRPFPAFQVPVSQTSWYADPQTRRGGAGTAHSSHASGPSSGRSSSVVSDYESRSSQGTSSNDTKSQSSTSSAVERERLQRASSISKTHDQNMASSEMSTASQLETLKSAEVVATEKVPNNADQSTMASGTTTMHEKQLTEASTKALQHASASTPPNTKTSNDDQSQSQFPLPKMPCVSTTGEGGKTVNGFLYNYTKGEVSIVCVCHGTFLSPAEFVQHAGGTDISNPAKHIVVNTSLSAMQHTSPPTEGI